MTWQIQQKATPSAWHEKPCGATSLLQCWAVQKQKKPIKGRNRLMPMVRVLNVLQSKMQALWIGRTGISMVCGGWLQCQYNMAWAQHQAIAWVLHRSKTCNKACRPCLAGWICMIFQAEGASKNFVPFQLGHGGQAHKVRKALVLRDSCPDFMFDPAGLCRQVLTA